MEKTILEGKRIGTLNFLEQVYISANLIFFFFFLLT